MSWRAYLLLSLLSFLLVGCPATDVIKQFGFTSVIPPNLITAPGTIIIKQPDDPDGMDVVCDQKESVGSNPTISSSGTADASLVQKLSSTFDIDADYLTNTVQAKYSSVKNVSETISNAKVYNISLASVVTGLRSRSTDCKTAVARAIALNEPMTIITSVIEADVKYQVTFDTSATVDVKTSVLQKLSGDLHASFDNSGSGELSGSSLYWGAQDNPDWVTVDDKKVNDIRTQLQQQVSQAGQSTTYTAENENVDALVKQLQATLPHKAPLLNPDHFIRVIRDWKPPKQ